jgi:hypothetical protein
MNRSQYVQASLLFSVAFSDCLQVPAGVVGVDSVLWRLGEFASQHRIRFDKKRSLRLLSSLELVNAEILCEMCLKKGQAARIADLSGYLERLRDRLQREGQFVHKNQSPVLQKVCSCTFAAIYLTAGYPGISNISSAPSPPSILNVLQEWNQW